MPHAWQWPATNGLNAHVPATKPKPLAGTAGRHRAREKRSQGGPRKVRDSDRTAFCGLLAEKLWELYDNSPSPIMCLAPGVA